MSDFENCPHCEGNHTEDVGDYWVCWDCGKDYHIPTYQARRIELLEVIADFARNYHELFEVGPGRNAIANGLACALHELDELERNLTLAGADAPGVLESKDDSPADAPSDSARGSA